MDPNFSELINSVSNLSIQNQSYFYETSEALCNVLSLKFSSNNRWFITSTNKDDQKRKWESLSPLDFDNLKCKFVVKNKIFIDSVVDCTLFDVHIADSDIYESNYECSLKLSTFNYRFNNRDPEETSSESIAKDLINFPRFKNESIEFNITLKNIPECFDIFLFYGFLKNSIHMDFELEFSKDVSQRYKADLKTVVDNIINNDTIDYFPPLIIYDGLHLRDVHKMESARHWWHTGELPNYR